MRVMILLFVMTFMWLMPAAAQEPVAVTSIAETEASPGDGATAVTIWIHPTDPALSLVMGTDDNEGLGVYDLQGKLLQFISDGGATSNIDIRYNVPYRGQRIALIAVGIKDEPRVDLYTVNNDTRRLEPLGSFPTTLRLNGLCMYRSRLTGTLYVIANSELGEMEQYAIEDEDGEWQTTLARAINIGSEVEGCVADDELGRLYIAEEETPVLWRYGAEPEDGINRSIVEGGVGRIIEQVEGVTLIRTGERTGYLLAANEQADAILVYERTGDNAFVGQFSMGASETIDSISEPNGMAAVSVPLGDAFPQGLFVTSDDVNSNPNADNNFKLVSWADVVTALGLESGVYDPRQVGLEAVVETTAAITISASVETDPVPSGTDAADDPSIWIHPTDTALSTIIGTDKTNGLVVYDLAGSTLQAINIGRVNNVDLRYNFDLGGERVALVGATNRTLNSLVLYRVNPETRQLEDVAARSIVSAVEEVYGFCMYRSPISGDTFAFINSADTGEVEQYRLFDDGSGKVDAELVRTFVVGSQTEGCVADDETAMLYVGEEAVGVWKYSAEPDADDSRTQVDNVRGNLTADVEGMALYYGADGTGYLIVSSQGSSEFVIYERQGDNAYVGTIQIVEVPGVDAVSGTDGLDVTNFPLGSAFPQGLLVVQDDLNIDPEETQNFKLVDWAAVAEVLNLTLDTTFDPRLIGAE